LKAGVMEEGQWRATEIGSPQGGVISPLMANIYLHVLDTYWTERYSQLGTLCRYADDFVIVCRSKKEAERALEMVRWIMGKLKLTLHPTKTHLVDLGREGFEFLGFHFHKRMVRKTGKLLPYFWPGQKAMKAVRSKIRADRRVQPEATSNGEDSGRAKPSSRGWRNYFSVGNSTKQLKALDHYLWLRTRRSFLAHHQGTGAARRARCSHLGLRAAEWSTSTCQGYAATTLNAPGRKIIGKPYEGKPHVRFDVAGNETRIWWS